MYAILSFYEEGFKYLQIHVHSRTMEVGKEGI